MLKQIIAVVVVLAAAAGARAASLLSRVPDDAIAVVYWTGADALGPACQGTHLQGVLDHSDIPTFVNDCLPKVLEKVSESFPDAAPAMGAIQQIAPPLWHHRTVLYWAGMTKNQLPKVALICQAGADGDQLVKTLTPLVAQAPFPVLVSQEGDLVVVSVGYDKAADALANASGGKTIADQAKFKAAAAQMGSDQGMALFVYIDGQAAIAAIPTESATDKKQKDHFMSLWGLDGWQSTAVSVGFDGKDWAAKIFVDAPAPRKGIFSFFDKAVDANVLKLVPSSATNVFAGTFDFAELYDLVHQSAEINDPYHDFDNMIKQADQVIGMDLHDDVLAPLGPDWVVYCDPQTAGTGPGGMVIANRPRDAAKLGQSLVKLEDAANVAIASAIDNPMVHVAFHEKTVNGLTLHYLATPLITPTWAIKDGVWYFGLYPSVVVSAAEETPGGKSILDNPNFAALRTRLGGGNGGVGGGVGGAAALSYLDLPAPAPNAYPGVLALSRLPGATDIIGVTSPVMLLPKFKDLAPELAPAGMALWADAAGIHMQSNEPFPGSGLLSIDAGSLTSVQSSAMMASVMLPALSRTRAAGKSVQSMSNERQILLGIMSYANDNQGKTPDTLGQVLPYLSNNAQIFVNPRSPKAVPMGLTGQQLSDWVDANSDYVWLGKGKKLADFNNPAGDVIIYEKPSAKSRQINCGYADGHVESLSIYEAKQKIPDLKVEPTEHLHGGGL